MTGNSVCRHRGDRQSLYIGRFSVALGDAVAMSIGFRHLAERQHRPGTLSAKSHRRTRRPLRNQRWRQVRRPRFACRLAQTRLPQRGRDALISTTSPHRRDRSVSALRRSVRRSRMREEFRWTLPVLAGACVGRFRSFDELAKHPLSIGLVRTLGRNCGWPRQCPPLRASRWS
jgi:hypothetical protein